eukprot:1052598_1
MEESCNRKTKQIEEVNRKSSRCLSDKHATHYKELLKVCLNQNVDTFSTDHPVAILDHMFAGNDHDKHLKLCPEINKDWCHYHTGRPHQTTMAYHKYMDRTNKYHKRAYEMVKSKVQKRFDDKLVYALRGAERTNGNENIPFVVQNEMGHSHSLVHKIYIHHLCTRWDHSHSLELHKISICIHILIFRLFHHLGMR